MRLAFAAIATHLLSSPRSIAAGVLALAIGLSAPAANANSRYAAIVVDANTGKTLHASSADSRRFPASLTKMMTLYMTFEALKAGKITKKTMIPFSAQASAMPPTKIGVKAGKSITVETAIYALVTKSANDAATALGEYFAGSEPAFARMMTAKARRLGMNSTVFRNASGLPDSGQFTTARDMATLGLALREHFPQYYSYFSTRSFTYGRQRMANHNRLLGRVKGVDGIKTGYTRASGFNLVSSVSDGNRRIVAVVMGGTSGASRDQQMIKLIREYLPDASTRGKGGPLIASAGNSPVTSLAEAILPKRKAPTPDPRPDDLDDVVAAIEDVAPIARPRTKLAQELVEQAFAEPEPKVELDEVRTASVEPSGWAVQVASSPSKAEAQSVLGKTSAQVPSVLSASAGYTVEYRKGGVTYHRARFGGFASKTAAWNACDALKKKKIACYAVQN